MKPDESKWYLITNFDESERPHVETCVNASGLSARYENDAYDIDGNLIPELHSMYIPIEEKDSLAHERYWECSARINEMYEKILIEKGYITKEFAKGKVFYLGCEKKYGIDIRN